MLSRSSETLIAPAHRLPAVDLRQRCCKCFSHVRPRCVHASSSSSSENGKSLHSSTDGTDSTEQFPSCMIQWQGKQWFSMLELTSELVCLFGSQSSSSKKKKSVTFADDCGAQLATIRMITEPSDVPPEIHSEIVRALLAAHEPISSEENEEMNGQWIVNFEQPCSNYANFRRTLNQKNVALENALLQSDQHRLQGTVKVKNLTFEKEVFIRHTTDGWRTYEDLKADFLRSSGREYDTFMFYLPIPPLARKGKQKIEFCVGYRAEKREFWDNNESRNYEVISDKLQKKRMQSTTFAHSPSQVLHSSQTSVEWPEFATWGQVVSQLHYW
uniref:CBM21 domain-containing protein n=1 Tax=Trichuris muris TaxID=70415 RepID=A0A5S6QQG1_TRIMR